jgi:ribosomal protein S18 acetylase RimI-like enzyme
MRTVCLHDRAVIAAFLRQHAEQRLYELGDLDDFFWPSTTWYALVDGDQILEVALAYNAGDLLVVLAHTSTSDEYIRILLHSIRHLLPRRLYAHIGLGLGDVFAGYTPESHGIHDRMTLRDPRLLATIDTTGTVQLHADDQAELQAFYAASYPGNWFDPRMLETNQYYGYREDGRLLSVAGIHVYAPSLGVAALGNITTHPSARGRGLATRVTARLCQELLKTVDLVGLNVRADNLAAIACYQRLGFVQVSQFEECMYTA